MRYIIGYGNKLRGEDGFGVDVIEALQEYALDKTRYIDIFSLTPELTLELQDADEIIFVDAAYAQLHHYTLACNLNVPKHSTMSHQLYPEELLAMLESLYQCSAKHLIFSMFTNSFDTIEDPELYNTRVKEVVNFLCSYSSKESA